MKQSIIILKKYIFISHHVAFNYIVQLIMDTFNHTINADKDKHYALIILSQTI